MLKPVMAWISKHPMRAAIAAALTVALLGCATTSPRLDRDWFPYLGRTAHVELGETSFRVSPISDWTYTAAGPALETYGEALFALDDLRNVWFMLEPQPGSTLAAHTLLLFEFSDDRLLGLTIEARREVGEEYSALRGAFNAYELAYVWANARDLLTRRALMLDHEVFVYPIALDETQKRHLLTRLLQRTAQLETEPRFYNTLTSNCTNELAKAADLKWNYAFVLTGTSDNYLYREGVIPGPSWEEAHADSDVTAFIRDNSGVSASGFDALLLAELRRRAAS